MNYQPLLCGALITSAAWTLVFSERKCDGISSSAVLVCNPLCLLANDNCFRLLWDDFRLTSFDILNSRRNVTNLNKSRCQKLASANEIAHLESNPPLYFYDWFLIKKEIAIFVSENIAHERERERAFQRCWQGADNDREAACRFRTPTFVEFRRNLQT